MNFENIFRSRLFVVILHICVWAIIFILPLYLESNFPPPMMNSRPGKFPNYENFRLLTSILNLSFIPLFYLNAFFFVPKFFNKKNWLVYLLLAILTVIVIIGLNILFRYLFIGPSIPFPIRIVIPVAIFMLLASTAFSFIRQNFKNEKIRKEKEAVNLKTELSFLRSQVSPHFLFNTLNNLVSLARKKSDLLEPVLLKLSGLLHYMLYESDHEKININKEIEYLSNYIDLQKLRFGDDVTLYFFKDAPADSTKEIVPMILIPFIENAFKHGTGFLNNPSISIRIVLIGDLLTFNARNKFNPLTEEKNYDSGIGLTNVIRRLNLLYPESRLEISREEDWHNVNLTIII